MYTLREKKTAENKQALLNALVIRMKSEDFDLIKINDLCKDASVSPASFYNYFPKKTDLLIYFVQLWTVKIIWKVINEKKVSGLKAIEAIFEYTAESIVDHHEVIAEIISFQAKWKKPVQLIPLTNADKLIAYPSYNQVENIPDEGINSVIIPHLKIAIENGELPINTSLTTVAITLRAIFFGIPTLLKQLPVKQINNIYQKQLKLVWAGVKAIALSQE